VGKQSGWEQDYRFFVIARRLSFKAGFILCDKPDEAIQSLKEWIVAAGVNTFKRMKMV